MVTLEFQWSGSNRNQIKGMWYNKKALGKFNNKCPTVEQLFCNCLVLLMGYFIAIKIMVKRSVAVGGKNQKIVRMPWLLHPYRN